MDRFVTLCYCALDRQRCSKDLSTQPLPSKTTKYQCEAHRSDNYRCAREKLGAFLCTEHRRKHVGEEQNTCYGITGNGKSCGRKLKGASYCWRHRYQECEDVEMLDAEEDSGRQSEDLEMGGM